jgi:hypothetical protein
VVPRERAVVCGPVARLRRRRRGSSPSNGGSRATSQWKPPSSRAAHDFYRVYRARPVVPAPDPTLPPGRDGIRYTPTSGADCRLEMQLLGTTHETSFVDKPPAGPWTYRDGLAANWLNDQIRGRAAERTRAPEQVPLDRLKTTVS